MPGLEEEDVREEVIEEEEEEEEETAEPDTELMQKYVLYTVVGRRGSGEQLNALAVAGASYPFTYARLNNRGVCDCDL